MAKSSEEQTDGQCIEESYEEKQFDKGGEEEYKKMHYHPKSCTCIRDMDMECRAASQI